MFSFGWYFLAGCDATLISYNLGIFEVPFLFEVILSKLIPLPEFHGQWDHICYMPGRIFDLGSLISASYL